MTRAQDTYDVVVIGAGTAGMTAARLTAEMGHKVAMIEEERVGGECLYTGCVPSKALIESAKVFHQMRHAADYGLRAGDISVNFPAVMDRKDTIIAEIAKGENAEVYRRLGIDVIEGRAHFIDAHTVQVGDRQIAAKEIVIATGSEENVPPIEGIHEAGFMTNIEVLQSRYEMPRSVVVLGGGPIGCEFAQIFARFGVPTTIVGPQRAPVAEGRPGDVHCDQRDSAQGRHHDLYRHRGETR